MTVPGTTYQDLNATQGDTWEFPATLPLSQGDILEATIVMTIKRFNGDTEPLLQISTADADIPTPGGIVILDGESALFTLTKEQTAALPTKALIFDVEVTLPSGVRLTPIKGAFNVEYQVT